MLTMARETLGRRRMKGRVAAAEQAGVLGVAAQALHRRDTPEGYMTGLARATQFSVCRAEWAWRAQPAHTVEPCRGLSPDLDRKSTRLNSSHPSISYAVCCL